MFRNLFHGRGRPLLDSNGLSQLHHAAIEGNREKAESLLKAGVSINVLSRAGATPLHSAASTDQDSFLRWLVAVPGINLDAKDCDQQTALHVAVHAEKPTAVEIIVRAGARVGLRDKSNHSPVDVAVEKDDLSLLQALVTGGAKLKDLEGSEASLHLAALRGCNPIVKFLLHSGISADAVFTGMTPLVRTFSHDSTQVMETLLDAGASVDLSLPDQPNLMAQCVLSGSVEKLQLLLDHSYDPLRLVNSLHGGISPLSCAIECAVRNQSIETEIIDLLLDAGANVRACQPGGSPSALQLCRVHDRRDLARKLLSHVQHVKAAEDERDMDIYIRFLPHVQSELAYEPVRLPLCVPLNTLEDSLLDMRRDFYKLPDIRGWTFGKDGVISISDTPAHSLPRLAGFLQEWLFFGLLKLIAQVVQFDYNPLSLLRSSTSGQVFIYTDGIESFTEHWEQAEATLQEEAQHLVEANPSFEDAAVLSVIARLQLIDDCINHVENVLFCNFSPIDEDDNLVDTDSLSPIQADPLIQETTLAISILGDILQFARGQIYSARIRIEADKGSSSVVQSTLATSFEKGRGLLEDYNGARPFSLSTMFTHMKMLQNQWCPSDSYMLHSLKLSTSNLYFLSLLPRPHMERNHQLCSSFTCQALQIDERSYKTLHATEGCQCQDVEVDTPKIQELLSNNKFPILQVRKGETPDGTSTEISDGGSGIFIAFSHVWGHGLGNPSRNSLPACQLLRLDGLARQAVNETMARTGQDEVRDGYPVYFWIDSLCVPLDETGRRKALGLLGNVYKEALVVLALDAELSHVVATECSQTELLSRVLFSPWMRRLWTLQEGLSNTVGGLVYQFADKTLYHGNLVHEEDPSTFSEFLTQQLTYTTRDLLPPLWQVRDQTGHKLVNVLQACCYRTSTKPEDELRCLASLLGLDMTKLEGSSRMLTSDDKEARLGSRRRVFWELLGDESYINPEFGGIPFNTLFMDGPRLTQAGFRWAPVSFLARKPSHILSFMVDTCLSFVTKDGLAVQTDGWMLRAPPRMRARWNEPFACEDELNNDAYIVVPYGREWVDHRPPAGAFNIALLREPQLAPHALIVVVKEKLPNGYRAVQYGWRARAFQCSATELRQDLERHTVTTNTLTGVDVPATSISENLAQFSAKRIAEKMMREGINNSNIYRVAKANPNKWVIT